MFWLRETNLDIAIGLLQNVIGLLQNVGYFSDRNLFKKFTE